MNKFKSMIILQFMTQINKIRKYTEQNVTWKQKKKLHFASIIKKKLIYWYVTDHTEVYKVLLNESLVIDSYCLLFTVVVDIN